MTDRYMTDRYTLRMSDDSFAFKPTALSQCGGYFYSCVNSLPVPKAQWVAWSPSCAALLGLPLQPPPNALPIFSGNETQPIVAPIATVYSGHQFGMWAGQLGDGRAMLLGELASSAGPQEIQLKGAGPTPYSRRGDGRAVLRSSIREFLCSEAFAGLGVSTTRALCVVGSAQPVLREATETAAVVTRVAPSFIRFGHFEHFAHTEPNPQALRHLADEVIRIRYPQCLETSDPYASLLTEIAKSTAHLMADWQAIGFCHGVMNTDNMSALGLTLDYGPFGFLDAFNPSHICNHSDTQGRYAFGRQPQVAFWNLFALAQAMLPLIPDENAARLAVSVYQTEFPAAYQARMRAKLGLATEHAQDAALIEALLSLMASDAVDYTVAFRSLALFQSTGKLNPTLRDQFINRDRFDTWAHTYAQRLQSEHSVDTDRAIRMNRINPKFVLRNHLAQVAIAQAEQGDFSQTQHLLTILSKPFDEQPEHAAYAAVPPDWAQHIEVSCSS
jgi:serine/tyrosine/threonine adenylyltransferase